MTYWHDTMHDDVFLIMNEGWVEAAKPRTDHRGQGPQALRDTRPRHRLRPKRHEVQDGPHPAGAHRRALLRRRAGQGRRAQRRRPRRPPAPSRSTSRSTPSRTACSAEAMDDDKITKALAAARLKDAKREGSDPDEIEGARARSSSSTTPRPPPRRRPRKRRPRSTSPRSRSTASSPRPTSRRSCSTTSGAATIATASTARSTRSRSTLVARIQELGERYGETVGDARRRARQSSTRKVARHLAEMGVESMNSHLDAG